MRGWALTRSLSPSIYMRREGKSGGKWTKGLSAQSGKRDRLFVRGIWTFNFEFWTHSKKRTRVYPNGPYFQFFVVFISSRISLSWKEFVCSWEVCSYCNHTLSPHFLFLFLLSSHHNFLSLFVEINLKKKI